MNQGIFTKKTCAFTKRRSSRDADTSTAFQPSFPWSRHLVRSCDPGDPGAVLCLKSLRPEILTAPVDRQNPASVGLVQYW